MTFKEAVCKTPDVKDAYQPGIQALQERDRNKLSFSDTREISGSLNLDKALKQKYPDKPVWDYGIGLRDTQTIDCILWLEVHPAKADEVRSMIAKVEWLKNWLLKQAPALHGITDKKNPFRWIASGKVSLLRNSQQTRQLAQAGISFPCEHLQL